MLKIRFIPVNIMVIVSMIILIFSCKEPDFNEDTNAKVNFSTDTVTFDTVFTTIGSTTSNFVVRNPYNKSIKISSIYLAGGNESNFRLNIDGISANQAYDIEILPKDSIYIFVEVTVDPNNDNAPLLLQDSIVFITNGNQQRIILEAWGQDVHFFKDSVIYSQTWIADKPYLIYGDLILDTSQTLTIEAGAKIHFHQNSNMVILGTLNVNGDNTNPVIFQADRLEDLYDSLPSQWGLIVFIAPSKNNHINFANIKNGLIGMQFGTVIDTTAVSATVSNVRICNMSYAGISAFSARVNVFNTVIFNIDSYDVYVGNGGNYTFGNCTFTGSTNKFNTLTFPLIGLSNKGSFEVYNQADDQTYSVNTVYPLNEANFINCIIYGYSASEIDLDKDPEYDFNYNFNNSLVKIDTTKFEITNPMYFYTNIYNKDPKFKNPAAANFELDTLSPAKDAGTMDIINQFPAILGTDLNNISRISDIAPDMGAYERVE